MIMDFEYRINSDNTVTITGYIGNSKDIVIPSEIEGKKVVRIGHSAFYGCNNLKSVNIPYGVTEIGDYAFAYYKNLKSVNIPYGVTEIGDYAFAYCTSLKSVTIPDSVSKIGRWAFYGCRSLTSITIPDSVTSIGDYAFIFCIRLTSITIPDSVTSIGKRAFEYCTSLTNVTIPDSVSFIGYDAFYGCDQLVSKKSNYKAFDLRDDELWCRDYEFKENEWSEEIENIELCRRGYHFCTNLFEIFSYYAGKLNKDIAIYECEVGGQVIESNTSKCVTNKIKPIRRLSRKEIIDILSQK